MNIDAQIAEVQRELAVRANVYPKWVATNRIKPAEAKHRVEALEAVLRSLQRMRNEQRSLVE